MRVLNWILDRCEGKVDAKSTEIGYIPYAKDIDIEGLDIDNAVLEDLLTVDKESWKADIDNIKEFYALVGDRVPAEMYEELKALEDRLG